MVNIKEILTQSQKSEKKEEIKIDWNKHANTIIQIANTLQTEYILNEYNKPILKLMLMYFTNNFDFELECEKQTGLRGSLNKGICLIGGVGSGKTMLFRIFKEYTKNILQKNSFQFHTTIDIINKTNIDGYKYLELFSTNMQWVPRPITCYIDDIASMNETVNNFGTKISVMEQVLNLRYNVFQDFGKMTHISTNKYPSELAEIYDDRIIDRMKEMFNIIELKGNSFRKNK